MNKHLPSDIESIIRKDEKISELRQEIYSLQIELAGTVAQKDAEIAELKGITPEPPPRPPYLDSSECRYGIKWNGPTSPLAVPMDDGYWTPFHVAKSKIDDLDAEIAKLEEKLKAQEECQERNDASNQDLLHEQDLELKKVRQENTALQKLIKEKDVKISDFYIFALNGNLDPQKHTIEDARRELKINNLEQQAKGVEKAADVREINWSGGDRDTLHLLAKQLRQQAKALEGEK